MLTLQDIQRYLETLTFMPEWSITAWQHEFEGNWITFNGTVEDSYHPGSSVVLDIHAPLPPIPDEDYLARWIEDRLARVFRHEVREWLKKDGVVLFDPHAPGANEPP